MYDLAEYSHLLTPCSEVLERRNRGLKQTFESHDKKRHNITTLVPMARSLGTSKEPCEKIYEKLR